MTTIMKDGQVYNIPGGLNDFQQDMYLRLIDWKWQNITREGRLDRGQPRDAFLPEKFQQEQSWPHLYPGIVAELKRHRDKNHFKIHRHFYHMASSQAANINLFLPVLLDPKANAILGTIKPDLATIATGHPDNGYCLEYWGGNLGEFSYGPGNKGPLNDKTKYAGTDADIAIAYENHEGDLCLWLIEHKLTEAEFTTCGGYETWKTQKREMDPRSRGFKRLELHDCNRTFAEILNNKTFCHYHDICHYRYWDITEKHLAFFANPPAQRPCPFQGGMAQLWRNQCLAFAVEQDDAYPFKHVYFSVVKHPRNAALDNTLDAYKHLTNNNSKFSVFTSADVIAAAGGQARDQLGEWIEWYKGLYAV